MSLTDMENPLVSIIVPCYNHEKYIEDSIEAIIRQDYDNIEVLIGDDCSKDRSYDLMLKNKDRLKKRFKNIVVVKNEKNIGVTKNLNKLIKKSQGEYIKIIASDDLLLPFAISEFINFSKEKKESIIISNGVVVDENSTLDNIIEIEDIYKIPPYLNADNLFDNLLTINFISAPCAFIPRLIFDKFGLYDEEFKIEDYEFWLRIASEKKDIFNFLDKKLIYYRHSENSMTSIMNNNQLENRKIDLHVSELKIIEKYRNKIDKQKFAQKYIKKCISELKFAEEYKLKKLQNIAYDELKAFPGWRDETIKPRIKNYLRMLKHRPHKNEKA